MSRIASILRAVNSILANNGRWEEDNLLFLISNAQRLIAQRTEILKASSFLQLGQGQATYNLPARVYRLYRVLYKGRVVPIRTREELDKLVSPAWETEVGPTVKAVVTNLTTAPSLRIYPIPPGTDAISVPAYGELTDFPGAVFNSLYGVVTDLTSAAPPTGEDLLIYFSYLPATVTSVDDPLELAESFDLAIVHYVAAMALRQNEDTQSRAMANDELQLFQAELNEIQDLAATSTTGDPAAYGVAYKGAFSD